MEQEQGQETPKLDICVLAAAQFMRWNKNEKLMVYMLTFYDINKALQLKELQEKSLTEVIPKEYHEFLPLFDKVIAKQWIRYCKYDHNIPLPAGFVPPFGPICCLSRNELQPLKAWIE
jgi:hypothetical protein